MSGTLLRSGGLVVPPILRALGRATLRAQRQSPGSAGERGRRTGHLVRLAAWFLIALAPRWALVLSAPAAGEAVRLAQLESGFCGACAATAMGAQLTRIAGAPAGWAAALLMALHPALLKTDLDGSTTPLGVLCFILLLRGFLPEAGDTTPRMAAWLGVLSALAIPAGTGPAILAILLFVTAARCWRRRSLAALAGATVLSLLAASIALPHLAGWLPALSGALALSLPWAPAASAGALSPALLVPAWFAPAYYAQAGGAPFWSAPVLYVLFTLGRLLGHAAGNPFMPALPGILVIAVGSMIATRPARPMRMRVVQAMSAAAALQLLLLGCGFGDAPDASSCLACIASWAIAMAAIGIGTAHQRPMGLILAGVAAFYLLPGLAQETVTGFWHPASLETAQAP